MSTKCKMGAVVCCVCSDKDKAEEAISEAVAEALPLFQDTALIERAVSQTTLAPSR